MYWGKQTLEERLWEDGWTLNLCTQFYTSLVKQKELLSDPNIYAESAVFDYVSLKWLKDLKRILV